MLKRAEETMTGLSLQRHPWFAQAIYQQAECLRCDGTFHLDEVAFPSMAVARRRMEDAVTTYRTLPHVEKIGYFAEALLSLCEIYYYLNYPDETRDAARQLIVEAEQVVNRNGGPNHPQYFVVPLAQGRYCTARGDYERAVPFQLEAARRVRKQVGIAAPWLYRDALQAVAGVYTHQGTDLDVARRHGHEVFTLSRDLFHRNAAGQSDSSRLSAMADCYYELSLNLSLGESVNDLASFYDEVLALRGISTVFQFSHRLAHDHPEFQPLLEQIRNARQALKNVAFSTDRQEFKEIWAERLHAVSERKELAESELAIAQRPFVPDEPRLDWPRLQTLIPDDTAFIDFIQYVNHASPPNHEGRLVRQRRILAYILKKSGPPVCVPLGLSREVERAITAWREAIVEFQQGGSIEIEQSAQDLARVVWAPLLPNLEGVNNLYIAPDGPLCFVSFAAMPGRKPGSYALEDFQMSYVNSGRWLYQLLQHESRATGDGLLLCGDIEYQRPHRPSAAAEFREPNREALLPDPKELLNLAATRFEIEEVAGMLPATQRGKPPTFTLSGRNADAEALESALARNWRCIHFAGHGFFVDPAKAQVLAGHYIEALGQSTYFVQRNQLLLSGLVLAPASDGPGDPTILTAEEVGSLDLRGTDLVVLSACETGLGCTAGSDGVLGLTRAFLTAGAGSVVSSLWKVDDAATSLLMEEFYRNLWEREQPKRVALRNAQLTLLTAPDRVSERSQSLALRGIQTGQTKILKQAAGGPGRSHPALWAAFVLNGDGR